MSDEARIARLTELARRVWPDAAAAVVDGVPSVHEMTDYYGEYIHIARHPRALDALEAALLVLAGEGHISYSVAAPGLTEKLEALTAPHRQPAWVEQLASKWEQEAIAMSRSGDEIRPSGSAKLVHCAAELRERAKVAT